LYKALHPFPAKYFFTGTVPQIFNHCKTLFSCHLYKIFFPGFSLSMDEVNLTHFGYPAINTPTPHYNQKLNHRTKEDRKTGELR
jgi:hypothetical protein